MALTDGDRRRIVAELDRAEAAAREAALATLRAFVTWLMAQLRDVYRRVIGEIESVWRSMRLLF